MRLPPWKFAEWLAMYYRIGLDEEGWQQTGTIAAAAQNAGRDIQFTLAGVDPDHDKYTDPQDYIPGKQTKTKKRDSVEEFVKRMSGQ